MDNTSRKHQEHPIYYAINIRVITIQLLNFIALI